MFRNPRENGSLSSVKVLPSTGRPPTPPTDNATARTMSSPFFGTPQSLSARKSSSATMQQVPVLGRQFGPKISGGKKNGLKPNQSILSFFGKQDRKEEVKVQQEPGLFFDDDVKDSNHLYLSGETLPDVLDATFDDNLRHEADIPRFNEDTTPVKRRRVQAAEDDTLFSTPPQSSPSNVFNARPLNDETFRVQRKKPIKQRGGFIDDSSDEEEEAAAEEHAPLTLPSEDRVSEQEREKPQEKPTLLETVQTTTVPLKPPDDGNSPKRLLKRQISTEQVVPTLVREATSMLAPDDFPDDENFDDEFFEEGEEFLERRWMEEQAEMGIAFDEDSKSESGTDGIRTPGVLPDEPEDPKNPESIAACPMCGGSMKDMSDGAASAHVNACLDGTAAPLAKQDDKAVKKEASPAPVLSGSIKRFQRAAIARPAQANPFILTKEGRTGSAFTRLMSGHAEDAAWAEAATNEMQSRGKPAYQRTCPFYKIMPGLYICVDAFRYGKVEGQNAYFLSHFHSDHYVGLTSSWCHGPIYASKVTCNLMRQQLKVDAKWIHPLEFEKKVEVPNTKGVFVTMLPANHCPGSSLYLFEKVTGQNKDGTPKTNRILHCGDFRACPAHVNHPLLKPDVVDAISGKTKQQIIDTCYLDTTYLTPKYSFPSQFDVIDACAQMCVSLSKEIVETDDSWEKTLLEKQGSTMTKFLEKGESKSPKKDEEIEEKKPVVRGRLLVVIGTYSIGKERICLGIARALKSKIYAPPAKMRICKALEDDELNSLLTSDPLGASVHMQTLMEIRAETLHDYLVTFKGHFARVVGFRPTGWTYRPPTSRFTDNPAIQTVLHSEGWKSRFTMRELVPQRGSTRSANCFGVPYSEHSSFRELTMFCCALRINRVIPTVNVGSAKSRERMKGWIEKWDAEKRKNGLFHVDTNAEGWGSGDGKLSYGV